MHSHRFGISSIGTANLAPFLHLPAQFPQPQTSQVTNAHLGGDTSPAVPAVAWPAAGLVASAVPILSETENWVTYNKLMTN